MGPFLRDLRYGMRMLGKFPGFAVMAILTLALGIGANVAIFSFVDELWLRSMPVPHADRLVRVFTSDPRGAGEIERWLSSYPDYEDLKSNLRTMDGLALLERRGALYDDGTQNNLVTAAVTSDNFFDVLQPAPAFGRAFSENELKSPQSLPLLVSFPFWRRHLGGDAAVVGRTIVVDKRSVTVMGILPRSFRGTEPAQVPDLWIPLTTWHQLVPGEERRLTRREFRDFDLFGRLREGISVQQANLELANMANSLAKSYPETNSSHRMLAVPEADARGESVARLGLVLLGIAALVLLIACANIASLLLARAEHRRKEIATRVALGATRMQVVRQLLSETLVLTVAGTLGGLFLGNVVLRFLPLLLPQTSVPSGVDAYLNERGLLCAIAAAAFSLFLFGVVPAAQASQVAPASALKGLEVPNGRGRYSLRSVLVVLQVAGCVVMLVSAGLLVRSVLNAVNSHPGFNARQNLLVMELVPADGTSNASESQSLVREFRRRVEALPGVVATSVAMRFPFGMSGAGATRKVFLPEMAARNQREGITINFDPVSENFFQVIGTSILQGRAIAQADIDHNSRVMVVNQYLARQLWPNGNAVGQRVRLDKADGELFEVVGIAENSKYNDFQEAPMPFLYVPMQTDDYGELALAIRTSTDPAPMAETVRRTLHDLNREVPILSMLTWYDQIEEALSDQRVMTRLIVAMGGSGLLLAGIGLYGLLSFLVARRTSEIGIRMALGAQRSSILGIFLGSAFRLTAMGVLIGVAGAMLTTQVLRSFLFGVAPTDALVFVTAIAVLAITAVAATCVPALRAIQVDPMMALRNE